VFCDSAFGVEEEYFAHIDFKTGKGRDRLPVFTGSLFLFLTCNSSANQQHVKRNY
jgi:hypothetical protein